MKTHYSISELLEMNLEKFPKTNRAILYKVEREKWSFIEASCQGGKTENAANMHRPLKY
nr:MAG TPA: hypothetical protein [Caudoviricetes sp.]